jgi:hypothetical protein
MKVASERLVSGNSVYRDNGYWSATQFPQNQEVWAEIAVAAIDDVALEARVINPGTGTGSSYSAGYDFTVPGQWGLNKFENGAFLASIGSTSSGPLIAAGDFIIVRLIGDTITIYRERAGVLTQALQVTDSSYQRSGYIATQVGSTGTGAELESFGGGAIEPAGVLLDDFERPDDTAPPPGPNWENGVTIFGAGEGIVIVGGKAMRKATGGNIQGGTYIQDRGPDLWFIADLTDWTNTTNNALNLYTRLVNLGGSSTDGYGVEIFRTATQVEWSLLRFDNAAATVIGSVTVQSVASGDQIALGCFGSSISAWRKPSGGVWTQIVSALDSTYSSSGRVGLDFSNNQETKVGAIYVGPPKFEFIKSMGKRWFPKPKLRVA